MAYLSDESSSSRRMDNLLTTESAEGEGEATSEQQLGIRRAESSHGFEGQWQKLMKARD